MLGTVAACDTDVRDRLRVIQSRQQETIVHTTRHCSSAAATDVVADVASCTGRLNQRRMM